MKRVLIVLLCLGLAALGLVLAALGSLYAATWWSAREGEPMLTGEPIAAMRPSAPASLDSPEATVLFGDLHVHTNYSADSFLQSYQIEALDGRRTPADACDFARFCSQLDFWSINDHAEQLTPTSWQATIDAVRACDASAGNPAAPDMVSFLGWEWSHADRPERHFGHKNVVLADLDDERIPARPIGSGPSAALVFSAIGTLGALTTDRAYGDYGSFHRYLFDLYEVDDCPTDVPSPELPPDCREWATTPEGLFRKLDEWNHRALVIPHGLAWGTTNPAHARLDVQLRQHDPKWQKLLEVYSGHGNSERYVDFVRPSQNEDGRWTCPGTGPGIELCCERAESIALASCGERSGEECAAFVDDAVQAAAAIDSGYGGLGDLSHALPESRPEDWGDCGQLRDAFLPAWNYRPRQSAQYALALGSVDDEPVEERFRFGFIAASDNHRSRPGTGYKEFGRLVMTDGVPYPMPRDMMDARAPSFYYSGGLTAVHAPARDRESVFHALSQKHVYGTSGDRILLFFDLVDSDGVKHPMGSERTVAGGPVRFEVRAVGAPRQRPGCPEFVHDALSQERIESLCLGECYFPSDSRKRIERIEVVRIRSGPGGSKTITQRIEDPWRIFQCPDDESGCAASFEDDELVPADGEVAYYVRAIQEASLAINGDPLGCADDPSGNCERFARCVDGTGERPEDCLGTTRERAWSSPIYVRHAEAEPSEGPLALGATRSP